MPPRSRAVAQTPAGSSSISLGNKGCCYPAHAHPHQKSPDPQFKVSVCTKDESADKKAAPQLAVSMSFPVYISCVCAARTLFCPPGSAPAVETHVWTNPFSNPWKSSYQPKDVENWSLALSLLLLASLSGCPGQTLVGQQSIEGFRLLRSFFHV